MGVHRLEIRAPLGRELSPVVVESVESTSSTSTSSRCRRRRELKENDIGVVRLRTATPLALDSYQSDRITGSFVLIDEITIATVAAGMAGRPQRLSHRVTRDRAADRLTTPVSLDVARDRPCLVVGGGPVAARKASGLLRCGALVTVIAPAVCAAMTELTPRWPSTRRALCARVTPAGYRLVVTATGLPAVDGAVYADAEAAGVWVNSADDVAHCTFILPVGAPRRSGVGRRLDGWGQPRAGRGGCVPGWPRAAAPDWASWPICWAWPAGDSTTPGGAPREWTGAPCSTAPCPALVRAGERDAASWTPPWRRLTGGRASRLRHHERGAGHQEDNASRWPPRIIALASRRTDCLGHARRPAGWPTRPAASARSARAPLRHQECDGGRRGRARPGPNRRPAHARPGSWPPRRTRTRGCRRRCARPS